MTFYTVLQIDHSEKRIENAVGLWTEAYISREAAVTAVEAEIEEWIGADEDAPFDRPTTYLHDVGTATVEWDTIEFRITPHEVEEKE